jgi:penicillin-binding protein 3
MGQYETYTPLQLSQYISTIASSGKRRSMHLLKEVHGASETDEIGPLKEKIEPKILNEVQTEGRFMNRVQQGFQAVMEPGGYGNGYINLYYRPSGKTGTSQSFIDTDGDGNIDTETITSSFIGYLPRENPKVSIVVTSPDSSHPNSSINYASQVTYRITGQVANAYVNRYGV